MGSHRLAARQDPNYNNNYGYGYDGYYDDPTYTTDIIIKWAVVGSIALLIVVLIVLARLHARRRLNKHLPPLRYHRFLLTRHERMMLDPNYVATPRYPPWGFPPPGTQTANYDLTAMPPPAYNPDLAPPPKYMPPEGGSKVMPSQHTETREGEAGGSSTEHTTGSTDLYMNSPGHDTSADPVVAHETGGSNNPYRDVTLPVSSHGTGSTNPYRR